MIGIVGIRLAPERVKQLFATYLTAYYEAMKRAIDEAGGSLQISIDGTDRWVPEFPLELRPSWADCVRSDHDGREFYVDIDGPVQHGVFVTQTIIVHLAWQAGVDGTESFHIQDIEIEPMRIRLFEDQSVDLGEARAVTNGLITAGTLMASLLEGRE